jgi:hypothetical protein
MESKKCSYIFSCWREVLNMPSMMVVWHIFALNEETGSKLAYIVYIYIYIYIIPGLSVHFMDHR